ncbi:MAG: hypothetical protein MUQ14_11950, partial [Burkholderiaceae bacterium]|nr:hypothetical protein [Burkholderiaceae bacterium]
MDDSVDVTFWVTAGDTAAEVAAKAVTALNSDSTFVSLSRLAVDEGDGTVNIVMARADAGTDKNVTFSDLTTDAAASGAITTGYVLNTSVQMDTVTFTAGTTAGALELTVDSLSDVYIQVDAADTALEMATKAKAALEANASFVSSGRTAVLNGNDLEINYTVADGTVTAASAAATTYAGSSLGTATGGGNITVGGVTVAVTAGDTKETIAASVATAMSAATFVTSNDGRQVTDNGDGTVNVTYNRIDADIADTTFVDTGSTGTTATVATQSVASTTSTFANSGAFEKAGELEFSVVPETSEVQTIAFGPAAADGTITVGGVAVTTIVADDTAEMVASKVAAALTGDPLFATASGRTITDNVDGSLTINYAAVDGDADLISFVDTGATGATASRFT